MEELRYAYRIFVGKPGKKKQLFKFWAEMTPIK
jgi:hypothetical protein